MIRDDWNGFVVGGGGGCVTDGWEGCTQEDFEAMKEGYYGA